MRDDPPGAGETHPGLADDAFVMARQENLETIHRHNVVAERFGQIADLRRGSRRREPQPPAPHDEGVEGGPWLEGIPPYREPFRRGALLREFPGTPRAPPKAPGLCSPVIFPGPLFFGDSFSGRRSSRSR